MTPREALNHAKELGFRLSLRPGGIWIAGATEPPPDLLALIAEHRNGLLALLEEAACADAAAEASLAAGRVTPFPTHLLKWVHPSIRDLVVDR